MEISIAQEIYSPIAVANSIIGMSNPVRDELTQLKLQKLTYLFYGWSFPLLGRKTINHHVEAWKFGPVFPPLYYETRNYGMKPIDRPIDTFSFNFIHPISSTANHILPTDELALQTLEFVWKRYGKLSASDLVKITHQRDTPWYKTYYDEKKRGQAGLIIEDELIRTHYESLYQKIYGGDTE